MRTAAGLVVDPRVHAEEIARFTGYIVEGPADHDCDIWIGGIGADGYGRFHINRGGARFCVRPHRYALALFGVALLAAHIPGRLVTWAGISFTVGILLFSGSLYVLTMTGISKLGIITPFGGLAFLLGWFFLGLAAWRLQL